MEAIAAGLEPLEFRRKVEKRMRSDLVTHDPDALFTIIAKQLRDQAANETNDAERRQTAERRHARSVAAAGTWSQGSTADGHDSSESAKAAGVKAERNRRYDNSQCVVCVASEVTSSGTAPKASRVRRGKASIARATVRSPYSSGSPQGVPRSIPGVRQPGWALHLPPLELVGTRLFFFLYPPADGEK